MRSFAPRRLSAPYARALYPARPAGVLPARLGRVLALVLALFVAACGDDTSDADPTAATPPAPRAQPPEAAPQPSERPVVLVLGNSLAAGYGLGEDQSYPALLQRKIEAEGWDFEVVNAGESGLTSAGGLSRIDWLLRRPVEVFVLALGGNDGLRGLDPAAMQHNLTRTIERVRAQNPEAAIVLAGMMAPPNLGEAYTERFREVFPEVARAEDAYLVPFLLEGVAGDPVLNQSDGIHPTARGQEILAENVWAVLRPVLAERAERVAA